MKPVSRYPPQNLSNPFAQLHQPHPPHQSSHLQHPNPSLQNHGFGSHHAFSAANHSSIFGPTGANGSNSASGGLHGAFVTGAAGGQSQLAFGHGGASLQQLQQAHESAANLPLARQAGRIREVWKGNLAEEFAVLRMLVDKYPYISMDTEFPGVVARPIAEDFGTKAAFHYQTMRCNVDLLRLIQLGITLFTADGEVPPPNALDHIPRNQLPTTWTQCPCTWSFNFKFAVDEDMYNEGSIQLLKNAGADFEKHKAHGIDVDDFGSLLVSSGLTFSDDVHWISFHGGYDFGYVFKVMWNRGLPQDEDNYRRLLKKFFPNVYDVKFILQHARKLRDRGTITAQFAQQLERFGQKPGLQDICDDVGLIRIGISHTAGSDAWLTGQLFFEVRRALFDGIIPDEFNGQIWGLTGIGPPASATAQAAALASQLHQTQAAAAAANGMMASASYHTAPGHHRDGGPSTPTTNPAGLASTPSQGFSSAMTPGAGGAFGNFQIPPRFAFAQQHRQVTDMTQLSTPPSNQHFPSGQTYQKAPFASPLSLHPSTQHHGPLQSWADSPKQDRDPQAIPRGFVSAHPPNVGSSSAPYPLPGAFPMRHPGPHLQQGGSTAHPNGQQFFKQTKMRNWDRHRHRHHRSCPITPQSNQRAPHSVSRGQNGHDNVTGQPHNAVPNQHPAHNSLAIRRPGPSSQFYHVMADQVGLSPWASTVSLTQHPPSPASSFSSNAHTDDEVSPSDSISQSSPRRKNIGRMLAKLIPRRVSTLRHTSTDLSAGTRSVRSGSSQLSDDQFQNSRLFVYSKSEPGDLERTELFTS